MVKVTPKLRGDDAHLVTQARQSRTDDIAYRERRYLVMMAVRVICFGLAILLFTQGAGWFAGIPAAGAIILPYLAVVIANGGREPANIRGFREYEPNLPAIQTQLGVNPGVRPGDAEQPGRSEPTGAGAGTGQPAAGGRSDG